MENSAVLSSRDLQSLSGLNIPAPPWSLRGEAFVLLDRVHPILCLVKYEDSPVGSYLELAGVRLTWGGPSVVSMPVNSLAAREGGRRGWGFPKELADLRWEQHGERVTFRAGKTVWRFRGFGPSFPIALSAWTVQTHNGEIVRVPVRVAGKARFAFRGRQLALWLREMQLDVLEASRV
ncbi:MAG TPA: hypothetical protein VF719_07110 [Abditibacteriaceae bacterium]|jgi:hypothetical protein